MEFYDKVHNEIYKQYCEKNTESSKLDNYRVNLDQPVYNELRYRYMDKLDKYWKESYYPPLISKKAIVLVERRKHPNLEFIIKNAAWAGPNLSFYIFHSDFNKQYILDILQEKSQYFNLIESFQGEGTREQGKKDCDNLMSDYTFYEGINAEYILTIEVDVFFRKKITDNLFVGDFWGCPWRWYPDKPGGSGLTIRSIPKMVEICKKFRPDRTIDLNCPQDSWLSDKIYDERGNYPDISFSSSMFMENIYTADPIGIHQFWTFIEGYFHNFPEDELKEYLEHIFTFKDL